MRFLENFLTVLRMGEGCLVPRVPRACNSIKAEKFGSMMVPMPGGSWASVGNDSLQAICLMSGKGRKWRKEGKGVVCPNLT
jgi:hypothetical protein